MTRISILLISAVWLSGCTVSLRDRQVAAEEETYTKAQVDAINAVIACKKLARNLVQIAQCDIRY
jgi:hypothetical protein